MVSFRLVYWCSVTNVPGIPGFKYSRVFLVCCSMYTLKRSIDGEDYLYCGESTDTILSTYLLVYLIIHINCSNLDGTLTGDHKTVIRNLLNCYKYDLRNFKFHWKTRKKYYFLSQKQNFIIAYFCF